ncbi:hypothetical protein Tco_0683559 [Tanacetum coccineum]
MATCFVVRFIQVVTVEGLQSGVEFCFDNACVDESRKALRVLDIRGEKKKDFQHITLKGSLPETVAKVYNILHDVVAIKKLKILKEEVSAPSSLPMERKHTVMSDSEDSTVTYTKVSSPFEGLSDIGSPGVVGPEYDGLPWMLDDPYVQVILHAPPSPDYVPGPEEPEQAPPSLEIVPDPVYPQFMPPEDDVLPAEKQPLPAAVSPTADSLGYVPKSDPKEDPEEDDDEDPEEDPADYPADIGDDGDDEDESSDDDEDDDVDIEGDEEEEEHPAPADSTVVALPAVDQAPSAEETNPFETDESAATPPPHPAYRVTTRMSIRDETPISLPSREEVERLLALPSPPPSPLSPCPTYPLGYRAAMIRLRAEAPSTSHPLPLPSPIVLPRTKASVAIMRAAAPSTYILAPRSEAQPSETPPLLPIPLPTPSPPLLLPSTDSKADVREAFLPPRKRLCFAFGPRYEVGESSSAPTARPDGYFRRDYGFIATLYDEIMRDPERDVSYRITDTWDEMLGGMPGAPATDETELGRQVTDLVTTVRQDINEIYKRLDDAQTERQMVTSRVNMLFRDRRAHARTARLMEIEARITTVKDHRVAGNRPQETNTIDRGPEIDEDTTDTVDNTLESTGTR